MRVRASRFTAVVIGLTAVSLILRCWAGSNELWLDEIWSVMLARRAASAGAVFTAIHLDNNHYLNTLYLRLLPASSRWVVYRLPAIVAGAGGAVVAALTVKRATRGTEHEPVAPLAAAVLLATSYPMVLYGSEARGYTMAVLFALCAVYAAQRFTTEHRVVAGIFVAVFATLGILAQLTYLQADLALITWTGVRLARQQRGLQRWMRDMALCHALPLACLIWLYVVDIRHMALGGGPVYSDASVVGGALSLSLGGPLDGRARTVVAGIAALLIILSLAVIRNSSTDEWLLMLFATVASPCLVLVLIRPTYLYERYFLVDIAFVFVALGWLISAVARRAPAAAVALVSLFVVANSVHTSRLITLGRGNYLPAMQFMIEHSNRPTITIGSDHDFRNRTVLAFYRQFLPPSVRFAYLPRDEWPVEGPEWLLLHSQDAAFVPPMALAAAGIRYQLDRVYPFAGISGWSWALYHDVRDAAAPGR